MTWGFTAVAGATVVSGAMSSRAAGDAASQQAGATQAGIDEHRRQFDITQQNLNPFLESAVGRTVYGGQYSSPEEAYLANNPDVAASNEYRDNPLGHYERYGRAEGRQWNDTPENLGGGALQQFQQGIGQGPTVPQLQQFQGQAVQAPTLDRFGGRAVQAPNLEQFQFDPRAALDNPALQFQQEMGTQAMERQAGKNRLLGSGQRLIEAQRFGQGLASQSIGDEFNRQLATNQQRNQTAGQQFGMGSQQLGQQMNINQLGNQQAVQQQGLQRQQLSDEQALAQQEQNRLLTQFGLSNDAFNQRMNRLAGLVDVGRGIGGTLAAAGQSTAGNVSNLLQAQGAANAAGTLGQANAIGGTMQNLAGIYGYMGGGNPFGGGQNQLTTAQQYGTVPGSQQTNMLAQQNLGF